MTLRYVSDDDSAHWDRFSFRDGDIVISTRSRSGTTRMQVVCALLVFGSPDLPASLSAVSRGSTTPSSRSPTCSPGSRRSRTAGS